jgi:hypothetical protein
VFDASRSRGRAFTVESFGKYTVFFNSSFPQVSGRLVHDGIPSFAVSDASDHFDSNIQAISTPTPRSTGALTGTSTEPVVPASSEARRRASTNVTKPLDPPDSEGSGINVALIVVPILVLVLAVSIALVLALHFPADVNIRTFTVEEESRACQPFRSALSAPIPKYRAQQRKSKATNKKVDGRLFTTFHLARLPAGVGRRAAIPLVGGSA